MGGTKLKLRTNLELSSFTDFGDIVEGTPKNLGVTWPEPRPLSETAYHDLMARYNAKMYSVYQIWSL